jgi:hypothetical protein
MRMTDVRRKSGKNGDATDVTLVDLMREMRSGFARMDEGFAEVHARIDRTDARLGGVEHRLDGVEHRLDRVEHRLDRVEHKVDQMRHELDGSLQRDRRLDARVTKLEARGGKKRR